MSTELSSFVSRHTLASTEQATWRGGQIQLRIDAYLTADAPPDELVTSARAVIVAEDQVLVMTNPAGEHILPGGRREPGESSLHALKREILEETGLSIDDAEPVAVLHYHHESAKPAIYPYPYPDFLNQVYVIRLDQVVPVEVTDTYEMQGEFVPLIALSGDRLPPNQMQILNQVMSQIDEAAEPVV
jgi:8-oxo-dGTP pyrophosphatase MutT (NUDIX family)